MLWSLAIGTHEHAQYTLPCEMIGTDEPSAKAQAHVEALIYGGAVITCDLQMGAHKHIHAGMHMHTFSSPCL